MFWKQPTPSSLVATFLLRCSQKSCPWKMFVVIASSAPEWIMPQNRFVWIWISVINVMNLLGANIIIGSELNHASKWFNMFPLDLLTAVRLRFPMVAPRSLALVEAPLLHFPGEVTWQGENEAIWRYSIYIYRYSITTVFLQYCYSIILQYCYSIQSHMNPAT